MENIPSRSKDLTSYILSLAQIKKISDMNSEDLLPQFDPLDSKNLETVEWGSAQITDIASEMTGISHLPKVSHWRVFVINSLKDEELSKFVNFYVYFTIDNLTEVLLENYGSDEDIKEDWRFYNLLCSYEYLDERVREVFDRSAPYVEEMRPSKGSKRDPG
jgi:hypothetical protein